MQRFSVLLLVALSWTNVVGCGGHSAPPSLTVEQQRELDQQLAQVHDEERQHLEQTRKVNAAARRSR